MARPAFPIVVHALIMRGDHLLLARRARTSFLDGWYAPPGGHLEAGEAPSAAARREAWEESGLAVGDVRAAAVLPYASGDAQGINLLFRCCDWTGEATPGEGVDRLVWADPAALPEPAVPWLAPALALIERGDWYREFHD